jgi:hypothetical protein
MAIEARKTKYPGSILSTADEFYEWLQDAPMKDEDQKFWLDGSTISKPKMKNNEQDK